MVRRRNTGSMLLGFFTLLFTVFAVITYLSGAFLHWLVFALIVVIGLWVARATGRDRRFARRGGVRSRRFR